jgi:multiple sugar transport system permease protein
MSTATGVTRPARQVPPEPTTLARARRRRANITGWAFSLPWFVLFVAFLAGPIIASLLLSFTDFGLRDLRNPIGTNIIGLDNFAQLGSDPKFRQASVNTLYFVVAGVPLTLGFGLGAAVLLNSAVIRFRTFFRMGFYLPVVTSIVAIAVIWRYLLHPDLGLVNTALGAIGFDGPNWLSHPVLAMPAIIAMAVWRNVGFVMVIFLAGLQGISTDVKEAARVDGASRWHEFLHITLPLLRPTMLFASVITGIGYLQLFEEPFVMTGGGPLDRTLSVTMLVYEQGFNFLNLGYASAIAYALFVAIVVLTVVNFRLLRADT